MIQSGIPRDLLDLRISEVPRFLAYNPKAAAESILWAREVETFMLSHHISRPSEGGAVSGGTPPPPRPFDSMHDLTVSQAMDRIVKTFPGLWVYADCLQPDGKSRFISFSFFSSRGPGFYIEE